MATSLSVRGGVVIHWLQALADPCLTHAAAVRYASDPFFLHDGYPGSFRDFLLYNLRETRPRLAAKLAQLRPRQVVRLYQQAKRRSRWNA